MIGDTFIPMHKVLTKVRSITFNEITKKKKSNGPKYASDGINFLSYAVFDTAPLSLSLHYHYYHGYCFIK